MGKKVDLMQAKDIIKSEKIFVNYEQDKFNYYDGGKYRPNITFVIPNEFEYDKYGDLQNPVHYRECRELTANMNLDFDGKEEVIFGKYRISQKGSPVFELTDPTKAHDIMVKVDWGGSFESSRGNNMNPDKDNIKYFHHSMSNGGGVGRDYYVVPVGYVFGAKEKRDVHNILEALEKEIREENIKNQAHGEELQRKKALQREQEELSKQNKDKVLEKLEPLIKECSDIANKWCHNAARQLEIKDAYIIIDDDKFTYDPENIDVIKERIENLSKNTQKLIQIKTELTKLWEDIPDTAKRYLTLETNVYGNAFTFKIEFNEKERSLIPKNYTYDGFENLRVTCWNDGRILNEKRNDKIEIMSVKDLVNMTENHIYDKMPLFDACEEKREELIEEKKRLEKQKIVEQEAKEKGYPNDLKCWNRVGGATSQGHTYVIAQSGQIKEPDDNDLFNPNHKYKYKDWLKEADGTQIYNQILPGDVVFSFSKSCTAEPLNFEVKWTPGEIEDIPLTPEQIRMASVCIEDAFDRYHVETALVNNKELSMEEVIQEIINNCEQKREKSMIMDRFTAQLTNAAANGQNKNISIMKQKAARQEPGDD